MRRGIKTTQSMIDENIELFAPSLIIYEVCNSIWKNPNVDGRQVRSLANLVIKIKPRLVEAEKRESEEAMKLAKKSKLTYYHAIYIALAKTRKCPLVTSDVYQLRAAKKYTQSHHLVNVRDLLRI